MLIEAGHREADVLGYSLGKFRAYVDAAHRLEARRLRHLLQVVNVGAQGNEKAVKKLTKALEA